MKPRIVEKIRESGLEFMGCYRAADGMCYFLGGHIVQFDYGDKEGYQLNAWKEHPDPMLLDHAATVRFLVSRTALATAKIRNRITAQPDLLKRLGLIHLKHSLDAGEREKEILLTTSSPDTEFEVDEHFDDPVTAQPRLREEILRDLALRHARGAKTIRYEEIRDMLCADEGRIQLALRLLNSQGFADGVMDGNLRLTDKGYLEAERVEPKGIPASGRVAPNAQPILRMDFFVSYAGEDRAIVERLVQSLLERNLKVWWDKGQITLGDRLSQKIEEGLRQSRYGLVIVSNSFVKKNWPDTELRALHSRAMRSGQKVILPVLLGMNSCSVRRNLSASRRPRDGRVRWRHC